jgi:hypothetical protein
MHPVASSQQLDRLQAGARSQLCHHVGGQGHIAHKHLELRSLATLSASVKAGQSALRSCQAIVLIMPSGCAGVAGATSHSYRCT